MMGRFTCTATGINHITSAVYLMRYSADTTLGTTLLGFDRRIQKGRNIGQVGMMFSQILSYFIAKNENTKPDLDAIRTPLTKEQLIEKYHREDEKGRFYNGPIVRSSFMGARPNLVYEYKGYSPLIFGWRVNKQQLEEIRSSRQPRLEQRRDSFQKTKIRGR